MRNTLRSVAGFCGLSVLLLSSAGGPIVLAQPKPGPVVPPPQSPTLAVPFPLGVQRGKTLELNLTGTNLADPVTLWTGFAAKVEIPTDMNNGKDAAKLRAKITVPADTPIGLYGMRIVTKNGISNLRTFCVDDQPQIDESADNKARDKAQAVTAPVTVVGRTEAESSDFFKFTVKPGQQLTFDVLARRIGSALDPMIKLLDAKTGRELPGLYSDDEPGLQGDARLSHTFKDGGEYLLELRDSRHLGGAESFYRIRIADCPAALTAWPVAVKRGAKATIGFTGRNVGAATPVEVTMPTDRAVWAVSPKGPGGTGWPVPVYASDFDQIVEQEPNNDSAKATKLQVPMGVTGRFLEKGDLDFYTFPAKKGTKYIVTAETYDILTPAEVYLTLKDAKGADLVKSNPQNSTARVEYTAVADGDLLIQAEHLNYLFGPNEVYHLQVRAAEPDFDVNLQLDRFDLAPGATTLIPIASVIRRDYTGPVEVSVVGHPGITGSLTIANAAPPPAGQAAGLLAVTAKADLPPGVYELRVVGKATINGKEIIRTASIADLVKTGLNGLVFPPRELTQSTAFAVTAAPAVQMSVKSTSPDFVRGTAGKITVSAKRAAGSEDPITIAAAVLPANVTAAVAPIPKGGNEVTFNITPAAAAALGKATIVFRATTKVGGKDFAYYAAPFEFNVAGPVEVKASPATTMLKVDGKAKLAITITRKGEYKGPVDVEVKNLPAGVTAPKVTIAADKSAAEVELTAAKTAMPGTKADVVVTATATAAGNQTANSANLTIQVVK